MKSSLTDMHEISFKNIIQSASSACIGSGVQNEGWSQTNNGYKIHKFTSKVIPLRNNVCNTYLNMVS